MFETRLFYLFHKIKLKTTEKDGVSVVSNRKHFFFLSIENAVQPFLIIRNSLPYSVIVYSANLNFLMKFVYKVFITTA